MYKSVAVLILIISLTTIISAIRVTPAQAALWWFNGIQSKHISICFVSDALSKRPDRVNQILMYIKEFEYVANVRFNYQKTCSAPRTDAKGNDYYPGDIRIMIPDLTVSSTGPVPGKGCPMFNQLTKYNGENDGRSWANGPDEMRPNRSCLYNMRLGDDGDAKGTPWLNHTLHEFGHALGLSHEHERKDATCYDLDPKKDARRVTRGYMTPYDVNSVMHYLFRKANGATCDVDGNYSHTGLSDWDRLALHIMYPEEKQVAEIVGSTIIRTTDTLFLQSAWKVRGANMDFVAKNFVWELNAVRRSQKPEMAINLTEPGDYQVKFIHRDFLGREYSHADIVRALEPRAYEQYMATVTTATRLALY